MKHLEPCIMCFGSDAVLCQSLHEPRPLYFVMCKPCYHEGPYHSTPDYAIEGWNAEWHDNQHGQMDEGDET